MAPRSLFKSAVFRRSFAVVMLLSLAAGAIIAFVGWQAHRILTAAAEEAILADAEQLRSELAAGGWPALIAAVAEKSRAAGGGLYHLTDQTGERRAGNLAGHPPEFLAGQRNGLFRHTALDRTPPATRTAVGLRIDIDTTARLTIGRDIEDQRRLLIAIYRSIGLGSALLLLLGVAGSLLLARYSLARIDAMSRASQAIMAGHLSERIPHGGSEDELDRLAGQLNGMLDRIEQLMAGLREVSDNIAHDLKTPLNRLRNRAETALSDQRGSPAWRDGLEHTIEQADELIKTFNALLLIARLEAGTMEDNLEAVDLGDIVRDVVELYEPVAEEAGLAMTCEITTGATVSANRHLIGQAAANLVDNAIKYSAGAGKDGEADAGRDRRINVTVRVVAGLVELSVADRGPGIPPGDRERALRRFVRLEASRSQPGTGLGLSLVAAVARLHAGEVRLEDNAPGLRVVLSLPIAVPGAKSLPPPIRTPGAIERISA